MAIKEGVCEYLAEHLLGWRYEAPTSSSAGPIYGKQPARPGGWRDPFDDTLHHITEVIYGAGPRRVIDAMRGKNWKLTIEAWPLPTGLCNVGFRRHYSGAIGGASALDFNEAVVMAAYTALKATEFSEAKR